MLLLLDGSVYAALTVIVVRLSYLHPSIMTVMMLMSIMSAR